MIERGLIGLNVMVNVSKQESGTVNISIQFSYYCRLIQANSWYITYISEITLSGIKMNQMKRQKNEIVKIYVFSMLQMILIRNLKCVMSRKVAQDEESLRPSRLNNHLKG